MANSELPFFGLAGPPGRAGTAPAVGPDRPDDLPEFLKWGTMKTVSPIWAEKKDSGKIEYGKSGITGHRDFVVPWFNPITNERWQDYVAQLLGTVILTQTRPGLEASLDPGAAVALVPSVTLPMAFHPTMPWLVCQDVSLSGEGDLGPDEFGLRQYRRAVLKCKFMPLDFSEKIDSQVQFQAIPGHRWEWIGQDARRAFQTRVVDVIIDAPGARFLDLVGEIVLDVRAEFRNVLAQPNPTFASITLLLGQYTDLISALMVPLSNIITIARRHDVTLNVVARLGQVAEMLNLLISQGTTQRALRSTGTVGTDRTMLTAISSTFDEMVAWLGHMLRFVMQMTVAMAPLPLPNADLATVDAFLTQATIVQTTMTADTPQAPSIATMIRGIAWPVPRRARGVIRIPFNTPNANDEQSNADPRHPMTVQRQIEEITRFIGAASVSAITGDRIGYRIRLYDNVEITVNDATRVEVQERQPVIRFNIGRTLLLQQLANENPQFAPPAPNPGEIIQSYTGFYDIEISRDAINRNASFRLGAQYRFNGATVTLVTPPLKADVETDELRARLYALVNGNNNPPDQWNINRPGELVVNERQWQNGNPAGNPEAPFRVIEIEVARFANYPAIRNVPDGDPQNPRNLPSPLQLEYIPQWRGVSVRAVTGNPPEPDLLRGDTMAGRFITKGHYNIEKHFIMAPIMNLFMAMMGCVNSKPFRGFAPWTLLIESITANKTILMGRGVIPAGARPPFPGFPAGPAQGQYYTVGTPTWTVHIKMGYNPNTWNAVYRGETQQFEFVRARGQTQPRPGPGILQLPARPAQGLAAETIILPQTNVLTLTDGTQLPIMTRGPGLPIPMQTNTGNAIVNAQAQDYGLMYAVCDFSIIDTFF